MLNDEINTLEGTKKVAVDCTGNKVNCTGNKVTEIDGKIKSFEGKLHKI